MKTCNVVVAAAVAIIIGHAADCKADKIPAGQVHVGFGQRNGPVRYEGAYTIIECDDRVPTFCYVYDGVSVRCFPSVEPTIPGSANRIDYVPTSIVQEVSTSK